MNVVVLYPGFLRGAHDLGSVVAEQEDDFQRRCIFGAETVISTLRRGDVCAFTLIVLGEQ